MKIFSAFLQIVSGKPSKAVVDNTNSAVKNDRSKSKSEIASPIYRKNHNTTPFGDDNMPWYVSQGAMNDNESCACYNKECCSTTTGLISSKKIGGETTSRSSSDEQLLLEQLEPITSPAAVLVSKVIRPASSKGRSSSDPMLLRRGSLCIAERSASRMRRTRTLKQKRLSHAS
jgi:hypothetical protein